VSCNPRRHDVPETDGLESLPTADLALIAARIVSKNVSKGVLKVLLSGGGIHTLHNTSSRKIENIKTMNGNSITALSRSLCAALFGHLIGLFVRLTSF
jgi:hypothetical protein